MRPLLGVQLRAAPDRPVFIDTLTSGGWRVKKTGGSSGHNFRVCRGRAAYAAKRLTGCASHRSRVLRAARPPDPDLRAVVVGNRPIAGPIIEPAVERRDRAEVPRGPCATAPHHAPLVPEVLLVVGDRADEAQTPRVAAALCAPSRRTGGHR